MLADGLAREHQVAPLVTHGDQCEVRGPAADVADEDDVADFDVLPPAVAVGGEPGVERGLRLLDQRDLPEAGLGRGLARQLPRDCIERRRDGQEDVLVLQAIGGHLAGDPGIPRIAEVLQVGRRGGDRRDPGNVVCRRPGEDCGTPIHPGMREPALGRTDQTPRHLGPVLTSEDANDAVRRRFPGQVQAALGELLGRRQIEERRQQGPFRDVVDSHDLGNRQARYRHRLLDRLARLGVGQAQLVVPRSIPTTYLFSIVHCPWSVVRCGALGIA